MKEVTGSNFVVISPNAGGVKIYTAESREVIGILKKEGLPIRKISGRFNTSLDHNDGRGWYRREVISPTAEKVIETVKTLSMGYPCQASEAKDRDVLFCGEEEWRSGKKVELVVSSKSSDSLMKKI